VVSLRGVNKAFAPIHYQLADKMKTKAFPGCNRCVLFLIWLACSCTPAICQTRVESLERFLETPPPFEVIAKVCNRDPESTNGSFICYYVLMRYQANGFFYREAPGLLELMSTNLYAGYRFAGVYEGEAWNVAIDDKTITFGSATNAAMGFVIKRLVSKASAILHLGIFDSSPGDVKFAGNELQVFTNAYGVAMKGTLIVSNTTPVGMNLSISYRGSQIPWDIAYEFASAEESLPDYLPSRIVGRSFVNGKALENFDIKLFSYKTGIPLSRDAFQPGQLTNRVWYLTRVDSTGAEFLATKGDKRWKPVEDVQKKGSTTRSKVVLWSFVFVNALGISLLIMFSLLKRRGGRRT
jgi:hypothetical protein